MAYVLVRRNANIEVVKMGKNEIAENKTSIFKSPYFVMVVLMLGVFIMALDAFIFAPALVPIVSDFKTSYSMVAWITVIYMLFSTAILPLAGKLSDVFGRKRMYIIGVGLFGLGSFLCSLSWNIYSLIIFRAMQAIGGGIIMPTALAAMGSAAPPDKVGKTMSAIGSMSAIAMILGPNVGGFVIQHFGWRAVFYINIPIAVIAILLALTIQESYGDKNSRIDIIGAVLLGGGLGALLLGLNQLGTLPFTNIAVFPLFAAALLLGALLILYEKRTSEPILDISLVARGDVLSLNLALMASFFGVVCITTYAATFAELVLKMGIQDSGVILTPLSISLLLCSIVGGVLIDKIGTKPIIAAGMALLGIALFGMGYWVTDSISLAIALFLVGAGMGFTLTACQVAMLAITPGKEEGASMGVQNTFRNIGGIVAPIVGGYFLNEALIKTISYTQAFTDLFLISVLTTIAGLVILAYFIIRTHKRGISVTVSPIAEKQA